MDVHYPEPTRNTQSDQYPLLMEQVHIHSEHEHIIDLTRNDNASSSSSHDEQPNGMDLPQLDDRLSSSTRAPIYRSSSSSSNRLNTTRNSTFTRRGDGYGRRHRSPLNSGLWITTELVITVSQIIASIVVLSMSRNENPHAPLFVWVVGYASGCLATLPILYWRFRNRHQGTDQNSTQLHQGSSQANPPEPTSYTSISVSQNSDEENNRASETATGNGHSSINFTTRLNGFVDHLKMALDCFFAVWFVVGNVWIFGGHATPTDAPKLYRLCLVFLTFSCIGYAMPFILCATICCCLPCIISVLGIREDFSQTRGATVETINALPTYKFNSKKNENADNQDNAGAGEGGVLALGTDTERVISGEDAVCCICLARYADNDELRELSCQHFFHVDCVDKWLKINASCPLCKTEVGESSSASQLTPVSAEVRG